MSIKIVTDSCSDLHLVEEKDNLLSLAPLTIRIDEHEIIDDITFSQKDFLNIVKNSKNVAKSACPSPADFLKAYGNSQEIFVVTISSELSGSYNSAINAKNIYLEENPNAKIHVINSLSAASAQALIYFELKKYIDENMNFEDIKNKITDFVKGITTSFVLDDLSTLIKNGRLNTIQAFVTKTFNIKPVMIANEQGTIEKYSMARGTKKALNSILDLIKNKYTSTRDTLVLTHCNCKERALNFKKDIENLKLFNKIIVLDTFGISTMYANDGGIIIAF